MSACECGCGAETPVAKKTSTTHGHVRGVPLRFIHGHNARKSDTEYGTVVVEGKQVKIHRLRAERALGKPLPPGAVVHHADGSRANDAPLVICQDRFYHQLLHVRMRVKAAGGNPNTDATCTVCKKAKPFAAFAKAIGRRYDLNTICKECGSAQHAKKVREAKQTHFVQYDEPVDRRGTARALCGERVHAEREHSNTPTCEHCQQRNAELDAMEF